MEGPCHQSALILHQLCKVLQCLRREQLFWDADGQPVLRLLRFAREAFFFQMLQQIADRFPVHAVRDAERPVPFQCAVTDFIGQARRFLVAWDCVQRRGDLFRQLRPLFWLQFKFNIPLHMYAFFDFGRYIFAPTAQNSKPNFAECWTIICLDVCAVYGSESACCYPEPNLTCP